MEFPKKDSFIFQNTKASKAKQKAKHKNFLQFSNFH
jgi:hypothetical protein